MTYTDSTPTLCSYPSIRLRTEKSRRDWRETTAAAMAASSSLAIQQKTAVEPLKLVENRIQSLEIATFRRRFHPCLASFQN